MDAIPTPIQAILDLFNTTLSDVRFADLDAKTLARLASEVRSAAEVTLSAQAALTSARDALQERQEALLQQVQRAVAYARVYAETDEALAERIDAIALPRPARRGRSGDESLTLTLGHAGGHAGAPQPARPRGRPRKVPAVESMLAGVTATGE
jgi:hypothetical protein